jgi:hypothetical protein
MSSQEGKFQTYAFVSGFGGYLFLALALDKSKPSISIRMDFPDTK